MNTVRSVNEYGDGVSWFRGPIIGKGGFGSVYLATLKNPKSKYSFFPAVMAVKSAEVSSSGSIQKEREVFSNVEGCPDIIKCFGEETTTGDKGAMVYNLLLEYGSGGTLAGKIKKSNGGDGLSELEVKVITRSILRGLYHIHRVGYVHCDLKPDNILLVCDDARRKGIRAKIGDLGLAKRAKKGKKKRKSEDGYWRGTPMYLSPETLADNEQESPSDIWALGCIVLEMLTGKPPWSGGKEEVLKKIGFGRGLPEIPNVVSKEARDFLKGCFVRRSMFRLTAEMLLNHPFVEGLDNEDIDAEVEDLNKTESILLVSGSDEGEYSLDSGSYWSEEENEIDSGESEESGLKMQENERVIGSSVDVEFNPVNKKSRKIPNYPVSFTVPAGV